MNFALVLSFKIYLIYHQVIFIPLRQEIHEEETIMWKISSKPILCTIGVGRRQSHIGSKRGKSPLRNFQLLLLSSSSPSIGNILFKLSVFLFSRPVGTFTNKVGLICLLIAIGLMYVPKVIGSKSPLSPIGLMQLAKISGENSHCPHMFGRAWQFELGRGVILNWHKGRK